jgi:cysteine desulfurase/selenocysteine lyase
MPINHSTPASNTFAAFRARFPGTADQVYLDVASRSLMPASALEIALAHLQERVQGRVDKHRYFEVVEEARSRFARLIGAQPCEIALTKNVSEGLNIVASAIQWRAGDEVVLCSAIEHPNNVYAWRNQEPRGAHITDLPADEGEFPLDAVIARLRSAKPPRVVAVSATSFRPGFRTDLQTLGTECHRAGALLVVDGAQSVGVTHLDVSSMNISALAVSTQKGLCALYGMGFLYVQRALAETLRPAQLARFGVEISATHEADYDSGPIAFRQAALRFDLGNYNFLAARLVNDSLALLETCGTAAIDVHVTGLADQLAQELAAAGLPVLSPRNGPRSHIVCLGMSGPEPAASLQRYLANDRVQAAVRGRTVRFSIHAYNNVQDIRCAAESAGGWLSAAARKAE